MKSTFNFLKWALIITISMFTSAYIVFPIIKFLILEPLVYVYDKLGIRSYCSPAMFFGGIAIVVGASIITIIQRKYE